ncbi:MAG: helix-turn-helix domain-containing protein [Lacticaseibacillus songhuajiangensis]|jgi:transcriptional regulator with XRE-family HTH domain|nr:helix-turn-helix domain-containing protein [Lacticaseibacillus songhuajiangensis]
MARQFDLGPFFKEYRQQRHISLRAASPESPSTLSRFENGETRIAGKRLRAVMRREGIRYWDLQQHSHEFISPFKQLVDQFYATRFNLQLNEGRELIATYYAQVANAEGVLVRIVESVLHAIEFKLETQEDLLLANDIQQQIQEVLFRSRDWIIFDYDLLWLAAPLLNSTILKRCLRRAIMQKSDEVTSYNDYFIRVLEQASLVLLCRHDQDVADISGRLLNPNSLNSFDGEDAVTAHFLSIVLSGVSQDIKLQQIEELQDTLITLELNDMARYFLRISDDIFQKK